MPQNCSNSEVACSKKMLPKSRQSLSCFEEHGARYFLGFVPLTSVGAYGLQTYGRVSSQLMGFKLYVQH